MRKVRITAIRRTEYPDLMARYELPMDHPCNIREGQVFVASDCRRPEGLCESAWESMAPFVRTLAEGGERIFGDWMRDPRSAMISCNDGFRPVSFYLEALDENVD